MATVDQARKLERKPPIHDRSRDSIGAGVNTGEGSIDTNGFDALDRLSDVGRRRKLLDYLAIDAGDEVYREDGDGSTDGEDGNFYSDDPRPVRHQSIPYTPTPGRAAVVNPQEIDSIQLGQIVAEEAERKQKARVEKELAWQKVRQLLLEEEEKFLSVDSTRDRKSVV